MSNEKALIQDIQEFQKIIDKQNELIQELYTRIELLEELFNDVEDDETFNKEYILKSISQ